MQELAPSPGKSRFLFQQTQQRAPGGRSQFFRIERSVAVPVCRVETFLDDGQIFVQGQGTVMIGIGACKFALAQSARQLPFVERSVMIAIMSGKEICGRFLHLAKVERAIAVQIEPLGRVIGGQDK